MSELYVLKPYFSLYKILSYKQNQEIVDNIKRALNPHIISALVERK